MKTYALSAYLQRFFTERLGHQMKASPNTIASNRDTFRLLLRYAAAQQEKEPTQLQIADIDADLVAHFLTDLETTRGNACRATIKVRCARRSWRVPAGESPAWVRGSARPVVSVAAWKATTTAKRTQRSCGVWE